MLLYFKALEIYWYSYWSVLSECNSRIMHDRITIVIAFLKEVCIEDSL